MTSPNRPRLACQTYTWQMSGDTYVGRLDHILNLLGSTGFAGVEPETQFLGALEDPARMRAALDEAGVELAALCLVEDWLGPKETDGERERADQCLAFLEQFPSTLLNLCQMPTARPSDAGELRQRQDALLDIVHDVSRRFRERGIRCGYHPNSPETSIIRTREDYSVFLDGLKPEVLEWIPDCGHLAKVDMDPLAMIRDYRSLVCHVHYKDMDTQGVWQQMGAGAIDYHAITKFLVDTDFDGWIVVEDESDRAIPEPDQVTIDDWNWIERELSPIVAG